MGQEELPLVSVITPSFNQARYIRETIESVLAQDYPHIEYIVIDGGSTDGTVEILRSYEYLGDRFHYISEPDNGQSHAINKGLQLAKGKIVGWLNSDDTYAPGAVRKAVEATLANPQYAMVYGRGNYIDANSRTLYPFNVQPFDHDKLFETCIICQPAAFVRADVFRSVNGVDENLKFCMDYDLWIRISRQYPIGYIDDVLANSRLHDECKSVAHFGDIGLPEIIQTCLKYYRSISWSWLNAYLTVNGSASVHWLVGKLKEHALFGLSPTAYPMNRYKDEWVPPRFRMYIVSLPENPLRRVFVRGTHAIPFLSKRSGRLRMSVYINGKKVNSVSLKRGAFEIEIPVNSYRQVNTIELVSSTNLVPSLVGINSDRRRLSCLIHDVIPYSNKEYNFYHMLKETPHEAADQLRHNAMG